MVAIVARKPQLRGGHKLLSEIHGRICLIMVGDRVGALRLKRALRPFGGDFIFARDTAARGLTPFDTHRYREEMLFRVFERYVLSRPGYDLKIGFCSDENRYRERLIPLIGHAAQTVICTSLDADVLCTECIRQVGICPDIVSRRRYLAECDAVFAPDGLAGFGGILFGEGGVALSPKNFSLPEYCLPAQRLGADAIDMAALLCFDEKYLLDLAVMPEFVFYGGRELSVTALCVSKPHCSVT